MDIKIVYHPSGDWEGLYINGKLYDEGHSIKLKDFVKAYNSKFYSRELSMAEPFNYSTRDLGNEEGFNAEEFSFPLKYEDIDNERVAHTKESLQNQIKELTKKLDSL